MHWSRTGLWIAVVAVALGTALAGCEDANRDETLDVALTGQYPPFSFYSDDGELVGFDVDVARELAEHMGQDVRFVATPWDGILPGLMAGRYDVIIGSMAITPKREKAVDFSEPYYVSGAQLFVHERYADQIDSIEDVREMPDAADAALGVVTGETYHEHLDENYPEIDVRGYDGTPLIFPDVKDGRLVGFVTDRLVGLHQIKEAGEPFVPAGDMLYSEKMAIPVKPENQERLQQVNAALREMKQTGRLNEIHRKWFGMAGELGAPAKTQQATTQPE
ncbi:MAG: transporter substrate-binding domain-containing protein [Planctomycetota bacterium]